MSDDEPENAGSGDAAAAEIARIDTLATRHDRTHGETRVRWRRFGESRGSHAPPLVLLHGGHGSWMHWLRNIEALSTGRVLWVPDLPGFNDSGAPLESAPGEPALAPLLDALDGTLDALVGSEAIVDLAGFSFGGLVAATLAARRGRVRRLALVGSGGHGSLRRVSVPMVQWRAAPDRAQERAALLHNLNVFMLRAPVQATSAAFRIHDLSCHGTRYRSKEISVAAGLEAALDRFGGELLLLWGEHDVTADPRPLVARLTEGRPSRRGAVIDGAGHWAQYEQADEVNRRMQAFFDDR